MSTKQEKWDNRFLRLAEEVSSWSKDPSTKCGAILVDSRNRIIATGYNGFPEGMDDDPALYEDREYKYHTIIHAEMNALHEMPGWISDCTMYIYPLPPCNECAKHIIQKGIRRIVTVDNLNHPRFGTSNDIALKMFRSVGVQVDIYPSSFLRTNNE